MGKQIQFKDNTNDKVYPNPYWPVGSIFLTVSDTNPSVWFGGTWEKMSGGFLYGAVNSPGNSTGNGTSTSSYTSATGSTKLTAAQSGVPAHTHGTTEAGSHTHKVLLAKGTGSNVGYFYVNGSGNTDGSTYWTGGNTSSAGGHTHTANNNTTAGASSGHTHSMTHSHSISYLAVWCWKRTA